MEMCCVSNFLEGRLTDLFFLISPDNQDTGFQIKKRVFL